MVKLNPSLIYAMAFYVFYIWILAFYNFKTRVKAAKTREVSIQYLKTFVGEHPPEHVSVVGRHYDNQFQLPMLFLITCCVHLILAKTNNLTLILAWAFIATRLWHSFIHLGRNNLIKRVSAFAAG